MQKITHQNRGLLDEKNTKFQGGFALYEAIHNQKWSQNTLNTQIPSSSAQNQKKVWIVFKYENFYPEIIV